MDESRCSKVTVDDIANDENINVALEHLENKHDSCGLDDIRLFDLREYC